jgi:photosystem II stability/assembly factor-like uncharacterized protein
MKNPLIIKNLILLLVLAFMASCSKTNEVSPSTLTGKWKHNGVTGKIAITQNGQSASQDINEPADNSILEFKSDGTAVFDGSPVTYKTSGNILTITEGGQSIEFTAKVSGNNLTLSFTKEQFFKYIDLVGDPTDPDVIAFKKYNFTEFTYNINYIKQ